jgi:raffinose/stachyose/melibiose transport system substrate-binding protein
MRKRKSWALLGILVLGASATAAGSGTAAARPGAARADVKLTWWHNASADPAKSFWQKVADEYHAAHPDVTIDVVPIQNEQFNTKIPIALQSDSPPDVFQQWGGGQMAEQVKAGKLMDITQAVAPWIGSVGPAVSNWQYAGKTYGVPYSFGIVGFWYNKTLFAKAKIASPPKTWKSFLADIAKLKAANITPIAIGGKDKWPDAFYWDYLAVRYCSQGTLVKTAVDLKFGNPCWLKAGATTQQLLDAKPFQRGYLATPAQQGAGSSAGLVGNGKAAMELQGHWNPGVMAGLTPSGKGLGSKLGWFPFPSVPGGAGAADAALGGGDGFSCSWKAPPECVDFLKFLVSKDVQTRWAALNVGLPVARGSEGGVADVSLKSLLKFRAKSSFIQSYLDIAYGAKVGQALDAAIASEFAGQLTPQKVVKTIADSAKAS